MNFIILGAGAIGCYVGGRLALGGQQVTFVGRHRVIDSILQNGLTVSDLDGFHGHIAGNELRLATSLSEVTLEDEPTVILLCVKGGATLSAAQAIAQFCKPETTIVSLQNGIENVARIMARAGIAPAQVTPVAPRALPHLLRLPNWLFTRLAARMLRMDAQARSSMADDLQQRRVTEIDDLCGAVVRLARANGMAAPQNEAMCQLIPAHTLGHAMSGDQMRKMLKAGGLLQKSL